MSFRVGASCRRSSTETRVGVLAIQGDFEAHERAVAQVGATATRVLREKELDAVDALILPGGESTTIAKGMDRLRLWEPIRSFAESGRPILGTCAGAILLCREACSEERAHAPVPTLGLLDAVAVRNAYGTQVDSFRAPVDEGAAPELAGLSCVFIRAPQLQELGEGVEVLARVAGRPVLVRQGAILAATFHPELTEDPRVHGLLAAAARGAG